MSICVEAQALQSAHMCALWPQLEAWIASLLQ